MSTTFALKRYAYLIKYEGKTCDCSLSQRTITSDQIALRLVIEHRMINIYAGQQYKIESLSCTASAWNVNARCDGKQMLFEAVYKKTNTTRLVLVEFLDSDTSKAEFLLSKYIPLNLVKLPASTDFSHLLVGKSEVLKLLSAEVKKEIHELVQQNMEEFLSDPTFPDYVQQVYQNMIILTKAEK